MPLEKRVSAYAEIREKRLPSMSFLLEAEDDHYG
jgi:hypothetical protein